MRTDHLHPWISSTASCPSLLLMYQTLSLTDIGTRMLCYGVPHAVSAKPGSLHGLVTLPNSAISGKLSVISPPIGGQIFRLLSF